MYTIVLCLDGKYYCEFRLQDGTERYTFDNLEEAVKCAKEFAKVMNGVKIKRKHITYLKEKLLTSNQFVKWEPYA